MQKTRALVVDDSAFMRLLISDLIAGDGTIEVVGSAANGLEAIEKVHHLNPEVIILDLNMDQYDGMYAIRRIMEERPTPIFILSSVGNTNLEPVFEALRHGAVDYMNKPNRNKSKVREIQDELISKIKSAARAIPRAKNAEVIERVKIPSRKYAIQKSYDLVAVGASTGGPSALELLILSLPVDFPIPIIICQHMPDSFIPPFVNRLNALNDLQTVIGKKGMRPQPGQVIFCPGHSNLILKKESDASEPEIDFTNEKFSDYNNPSINAMMQSVAKVYGERSVGIILTGMGKDGLKGITKIKKKGGFVIAQNKESSVIYGMPKVASESGNVDIRLDIKEIGSYLSTVLK